MYCKNCGAKVSEKANFCNRCGKSLSLESSDSSGFSTDYISDDDFRKAYVFNHYEKLKEERFSVPFFFLNGYYLFYRKMWLYAFLWILFVVGINIFTFFYEIPYLFLVLLFFRIFLSFYISKIYLRFVDQKIEKIKQKNLDKTKQEILHICRKKGGVSVLAVILSIIFMCTVIFFTIMGLVLGVFIEEMKQEDESKNTYFHELHYTVPKVFEGEPRSTDSYQNFRYQDDATSCYMNIMSNRAYPNKKEEDYLNSIILYSSKAQKSDILSRKINGSTWKYVEAVFENQVAYYYVSIYNGQVYRVQYVISRDDYNLCSTGYTNFIDSLVFQDMNYEVNRVSFIND